MCVPCKVVINEEGQRAAGLADTLREIIAGTYDRELSREADEEMFRLAKCEVEHIEQVRAMTREALRHRGVPERWMKLIERAI